MLRVVVSDDALVLARVGLWTPLGNLAETFDAILAGRRVEPTTPHVQRDQTRALVARALSATRDARVRRRDVNDRTALLVATSRGNLESCLAGGLARRSRDDATLGIHALAHHLARALHHTTGPRLTISAACAGGLLALARAAALLNHGDAETALVVAAESSSHPVLLHSLEKLGVAHPAGCCPFDEARQGIGVAPCAAAVWLERRTPHAGEVTLAAVAQLGQRHELVRATADDDTYDELLMRLDARACAAVVAHATGTPLNDAAEASAVARHAPRAALTSFKGALQHGLGAAGLAAVVLAAECARRGVVPATVGCAASISPQVTRAATPIAGDVVVLAAGFGGAAAGVRLARVAGRV